MDDKERERVQRKKESKKKKSKKKILVIQKRLVHKMNGSMQKRWSN